MFWSIDLRIDLSSNATRPSLQCMLIVLWWDIYKKKIKSIEYLWGFRAILWWFIDIEPRYKINWISMGIRAILWWLIDIEPRYKINWISILWKRFKKGLIMGILRPPKNSAPFLYEESSVDGSVVWLLICVAVVLFTGWVPLWRWCFTIGLFNIAT